MGYGKIRVGSRDYVKFIPYPQAVRDGTARCFSCGQIDEPDYHEADLCPGMGGTLPQTDKVKAFIAANAESPVISGTGYATGGGRYTLKNGKTFVFTLYESRSMAELQPRWDLPA